MMKPEMRQNSELSCYGEKDTTSKKSLGNEHDDEEIEKLIDKPNDDSSASTSGGGLQKRRWLLGSLLLLLYSFTLLWIYQKDVDHMCKAKATRKAGQQVVENVRIPPLVLLTRSCSGSTFLIRFVKTLVERHTGLDPHGTRGEMFKLNENNKQYVKLYDESLARKNKVKADAQFVIDNYMPVAENSSQVMMPKILDHQFSEGIASALMSFDARFVLIYRRNLLERTVCRIRDCFQRDYLKHYPVFENGTKSSLCFHRRHFPESKTYAKIDIKDFKRETHELVETWGCKGAVEAEDLVDQLEEAMIRSGKIIPQYPKLALESLEAFEYSEMYSNDFNKSLADWKSLLLGWGIEPQEQIILDEMSNKGINIRKHSSALVNVYNKVEIEEAFENMAADSNYCDWRWMTQQQDRKR